MSSKMSFFLLFSLHHVNSVSWFTMSTNLKNESKRRRWRRTLLPLMQIFNHISVNFYRSLKSFFPVDLCTLLRVVPLASSHAFHQCHRAMPHLLDEYCIIFVSYRHFLPSVCVYERGRRRKKKSRNWAITLLFSFYSKKKKFRQRKTDKMNFLVRRWMYAKIQITCATKLNFFSGKKKRRIQLDE